MKFLGSDVDKDLRLKDKDIEVSQEQGEVTFFTEAAFYILY